MVEGKRWRVATDEERAALGQGRPRTALQLLWTTAVAIAATGPLVACNAKSYSTDKDTGTFVTDKDTDTDTDTDADSDADTDTDADTESYATDESSPPGSGL